MKELKDRILADGRALNETVLKVDSFLNHQVDAKLMYEMGTYFKEYFKNHGITRILTIESSGIAPTAMTALQMDLPMVILKKQKSKILNGEAALGAARLVEMAGAKVAGIGIVIEKSFQVGRGKLEDKGYDVYSLARISKLGKDLIEFID